MTDTKKIAVCTWCRAEMAPMAACLMNKVVEFPDGMKMSSIPNGSENLGLMCHDCGVAPGANHHPGCDAERCPRCRNLEGGRGQLISCGCLSMHEDFV